MDMDDTKEREESKNNNRKRFILFFFYKTHFSPPLCINIGTNYVSRKIPENYDIFHIIIRGGKIFRDYRRSRSHRTVYLNMENSYS
jgi:hypothetical protein